MTGFPVFHDPPAGGYLTFLAEELNERGVAASVLGRGYGSSLVFDDANLAEMFGSVYFHQPEGERAVFIWKSGGRIGPVADVKAAADLVQKVVGPQ